MKKCIYLMVSLVFSVLIFTSCSSEKPEGTRGVTVYFSNSEMNSLVSENLYLKEEYFNDETDFVRAVMEKLISGPSDSQHTGLIPEGVYIRGISMSDEPGTVNIDLGGPYYNPKEKYMPSKELLTRYSIVKSVCQLESIKKVKFFVNGYDMKTNNGTGEILTAIASESILINSPSSGETQTEKFVTLYFKDSKTGVLSAETRKATMTDNSLEKTVVGELLRGPSDGKLEKLIPDNVGIISVETTEEVCFVNFSSEFISKSDTASSDMKLAVYSVVNSLTRLSGIDKVQILVDGKKPETDTQQLFSTPLERDESLINENAK